MQFLTGKSLLYVRVIMLLVIPYYLIKYPETISSAGFVVLLGQAMQVPILKLNPTNPLIGFLSIFMITTSITDLIPLIAENWPFFETVVPTRLFFYFLATAYIYFVPTSIISNSLIITYTMFEIWINFLIYNNLRDEKFYRMKKFVEENVDALKQAQDERVKIIERD
ncbi:uncharacterized protein KGF55_000559 [Candida pseudojiufengensis]|uniref:uncharacterized protein n=1 Tax=Candida pseudojiufengensis TaxID=497109 RepID=UPI0022254393|nr:uncharacterized protein KGF55_000559 [Candida pseudojiufengensis]KAI5966250.1 hypothetical protein KGF55_000559 [Candida pseudojiufengensis]